MRLGVTTKSDLIARDIDLLREVARRHYLSIHMTVTTLDRELARLIEPMAPRPDLRLNAVRKLTSAGLRASVFCSPVMPIINDGDPSSTRWRKRRLGAGARNFGGNILFLKPCSKQVFLPFIDEQFPQLARKYRERYGRVAYLRGDYPERIAERIQNIRRRYGFDKKQAPEEPELWPKDSQMALF